MTQYMKALSMWAIVICSIIVHLASAQQTTTGPLAATATSPAATAATAPAATQSQVPIACNPSGSRGTVVVTAPLPGSYCLVGTPCNITWTYSTNTNRIYPAKSISIKYKTVKASQYDQVVANSLPANATSFKWNISQVAPGLYGIKVIADGIDPFAVGSNTTNACLPDNFPLPGVTTGFYILISERLIPYPDTYGPQTSGGTARRGSLLVLVISGLVSFAVAYGSQMVL
ncbi:hypothetical protein SeMB42_g02453 [Synchytrium endobioticum]|uniref:Fibronectin type-III domain-containing protein n=1 Tax=Synchytrium endobioticum TaxID=286115 RepID=A0A507DG71_9FUNG|nr:hypothetical protein SeLEV6574_g01821 [Synchytrium endobioticum]TPX49830.1 hypothetical protein SeMB42_g02453 [Synchytrium endobioticum]